MCIFDLQISYIVGEFFWKRLTDNGACSLNDGLLNKIMPINSSASHGDKHCPGSHFSTILLDG